MWYNLSKLADEEVVRMKDTRGERKKKMTRMVAMAVAAVMILSVVSAAILSQIW